MNLQQKRDEINAKFEAVKKEAAENEKKLMLNQEELVRLQGEFRLINELLKEENGLEIGTELK
jgi:hypothetical protein